MTTKASIDGLNNDKVEYSRELSQIIGKVGPLEDNNSRFWNDISALLAKLNATMNECKSAELLLKKYEEESTVGC